MAATRCGSCCKFVSLEEGDPEVEDLDIEDSGEINYKIRVIRVCGECGDELKEAFIEGSTEFSNSALHVGEGHDLSIEEQCIEGLERSEGTGRNERRFYGFELEATVKCSCSSDEHKVTIHDDVQGSDFENME